MFTCIFPHYHRIYILIKHHLFQAWLQKKKSRPARNGLKYHTLAITSKHNDQPILECNLHEFASNQTRGHIFSFNKVSISYRKICKALKSWWFKEPTLLLVSLLFFFLFLLPFCKHKGLLLYFMCLMIMRHIQSLTLWLNFRHEKNSKKMFKAY